jgi:thioesterase domain-containing protein
VIATEAGIDPVAAEAGGTAAGSSTPRRRSWTTLVPIQSKGARSPFYCAAGQGGNAMNLRHVAVHLGEDQPFYGLQARGVDGRLRPHETVEAMAAEYVADIRRFQPRGPYRIGGYSGGGTVAFEMAHQFVAAGERVEALVFLDSYSRAMPVRSRADRLRLHVRRLFTQGPGYAFEKLRDRIMLHDLAVVRRVLLKPFLRWFPDRFREDSMIYSWTDAFMRYQPRPWDGAAHLFRVKLDEQSQWSGVRVEEDLGWRSLVSRLVVAEVPGDHNSMCQEPNARVLADLLRACLDAAGESALPTPEGPVSGGKPISAGQLTRTP